MEERSIAYDSIMMKKEFIHMDTHDNDLLVEEVIPPDYGSVPCYHYVADEEDEVAEEEGALIEEVIPPDYGSVPCHHYVADEEDESQ